MEPKRSVRPGGFVLAGTSGFVLASCLSPNGRDSLLRRAATPDGVMMQTLWDLSGARQSRTSFSKSGGKVISPSPQPFQGQAKRSQWEGRKPRQRVAGLQQLRRHRQALGTLPPAVMYTRFPERFSQSFRWKCLQYQWGPLTSLAGERTKRDLNSGT